MEELNNNNINSMRKYVVVVSLLICFYILSTYVCTHIALSYTYTYNIIKLLLINICVRLRLVCALILSMTIKRLVNIMHLIGVYTCLNDYIYAIDYNDYLYRRGDSKNQGLFSKMALDAYTKLSIFKLFPVEVFGRCEIVGNDNAYL